MNYLKHFNEALIYALGYGLGSHSFALGLFAGGMWFSLSCLMDAIRNAILVKK